MGASLGTHSYSTNFGIDPAGGTTYVNLAEVVDDNGPDIAVGSTKFTHLNSDNAFHEYKPGLGEGGNLSLKLNFAKAQFNTLLGYLRTAGMAWKITYPLVGAEVTASKLEGKGHLAKLGKAIPD